MSFIKTTEQDSNYNHLEKMSITEVLTNINNEDKVVVNIIDNINLLLALDFFAKRKKVRSKLFIIFHLHSYNFDVDVNKRNKIYNAINKIL